VENCRQWVVRSRQLSEHFFSPSCPSSGAVFQACRGSLDSLSFHADFKFTVGPGHALAPYSYGKSAAEAFGHLFTPIPATAPTGPKTHRSRPALSLTADGYLAGGHPTSNQKAECESCGFKSSFTWRTGGRPNSTRCAQCSRVRDEPLAGRNGQRFFRIPLPLKIRFPFERFV
jgi:hypothetical protein